MVLVRAPPTSLEEWAAQAVAEPPSWDKVRFVAGRQSEESAHCGAWGFLPKSAFKPNCAPQSGTHPFLQGSGSVR